MNQNNKLLLVSIFEKILNSNSFASSDAVSLCNLLPDTKAKIELNYDITLDGFKSRAGDTGMGMQPEDDNKQIKGAINKNDTVSAGKYIFQKVSAKKTVYIKNGEVEYALVQKKQNWVLSLITYKTFGFILTIKIPFYSVLKRSAK